MFDVNGFHVESYKTDSYGPTNNGEELAAMYVTTNSTFRIVIEKGPPQKWGGSIALFDRATQLPLLSASDANGDGVLDAVSYSTLDASGTRLLTFLDYDLDGQLDLRSSVVPGYDEIWHLGQPDRGAERPARDLAGRRLRGALAGEQQMDGSVTTTAGPFVPI